jgi:hypothetical protein
MQIGHGVTLPWASNASFLGQVPGNIHEPLAPSKAIVVAAARYRPVAARNDAFARRDLIASPRELHGEPREVGRGGIRADSMPRVVVALALRLSPFGWR